MTLATLSLGVLHHTLLLYFGSVKETWTAWLFISLVLHPKH